MNKPVNLIVNHILSNSGDMQAAQDLRNEAKCRTDCTQKALLTSRDHKLGCDLNRNSVTGKTNHHEQDLETFEFKRFTNV